MLKRISLLAWLGLIALGIFPGEAHAYLDPGTGSAILQALAFALLAVGGAWYGFKAKIKNVFKKIIAKQERPADE